MPRVVVNIDRLDTLAQECDAIAANLKTIQSDFWHQIQKLDWEVRYSSDINRTATQISRKIESYVSSLTEYQKFLQDAYQKYSDLDTYKDHTDLNGEDLIIEVKEIDPVTVGPGGQAPVITIDDALNRIKSWFDGLDKFQDNAEAGVLKDLVSYLKDLMGFYDGDKKGLAGAGALCSLADSSIGLWKGLYDYFHDMYDGMNTGFFGKAMEKNTKIMGLSAGILGLTASLISAGEDWDSKSWQKKVADYIDCGKDVFSTIKAGYEVKHFGDLKSLADLKTGPWSALDLYKAVVEIGTNSVSQGFRSFEKYYADGQWTLEDTGATGLDVSMAGIYGFSHSLSCGLDDIVFDVVDRISGGNGNSDMSYFEKAAAGYKIMAEKCGTAIGKWWSSR